MEDKLEQYGPSMIMFLTVVLTQGLDHLMVLSGRSFCLSYVLIWSILPSIFRQTRKKGISQTEKRFLLAGHTIFCLAISVVLICLHFSWLYIFLNGLDLWLILLGSLFNYEIAFLSRQKGKRSIFIPLIFILSWSPLWQWSVELLLLLYLLCFTVFTGCNYFSLKKAAVKSLL